MTAAYGIDFGTSNSAVAMALGDGEVRVAEWRVPDLLIGQTESTGESGARFTSTVPSVLFAPNYEQGIHVGHEAIARYLTTARDQYGVSVECFSFNEPDYGVEFLLTPQENADFIVGFIKAAKQYHGVDIDFCGIWNETAYDVPWIKLLRKTLNNAGLSRVAIVAADDNWNIVGDLNQDAALREAVKVVGMDYPSGLAFYGNQISPTSPETAKQCGKPLWASEDGPWRDNWAGACALAKMCNRNYINAKIVKTVAQLRTAGGAPSVETHRHELVYTHVHTTPSLPPTPPAP